ncbi:MAG: serine/threonine-protein kinase [Acidobacteria bacterium]|nr:serine/threonine-protein kinase [Acidobacteriota bacterium]
MIGQVLGPYQILSKLGEGGMGEVYRGRDTKLNRDVAIKVLPESFALDADRVARFTREAQVLASLNHPNIAAIYGIEEFREKTSGVFSGSTSAEKTPDVFSRALVMELVEGEDLSAHIARGAIPLAEALPIAKQIADALEAAHEQGIVHRDLKPQNIKVRADGTVKVLDFGLAKATDRTLDSGPGTQDPNNSPTMTSPAMTAMGMILGTAAYMSPEQAKGRAVDKRADIWAFGVVLHEMLTGGHLFLAETIPETLAHVMTRQIDLGTMPASTPRRIRDLLARCLEKDPKKRLRDIGEARIRLEEVISGSAEEPTILAGAIVAAPPPKRTMTIAFAALAGVTTIALATVLFMWAPWRTTLAPSPTPRKLLAGIGADASLSLGVGAAAILSPDGTTLAFVAVPANQGRPVLFVRKLEELQATALAGTDEAASPFFSPDGQWIAYFAGGQLKKVSATGGASIKLCDAPAGRGGTWTDDDTILFTPDSSPNTRLMRVPAGGGAASAFGTLGTGATTQRWPQALPDGRSVLYTEHSGTSNFDTANLVVAPLSGGAPKIVVPGGYYGRYVSGGHLIYMNQGTLFAVRFDLDRLETVGPAVPAIEGITVAGNGGAQLAVSSDGTIVYVAGAALSLATPIDWLTRDGKTSLLRADNANWQNPRFSPDGQKLAIDISDGKRSDVWVYEVARGTLTQLTFDAANDMRPVWTPDGRRIVFASDRAKAGVFNLYWANADGTGQVTRLTDSPNLQWPQSWHPSGTFLAFAEVRGAATGSDLLLLPMEGDATRGWTPGTPTVFLGTRAAEGAPVFSPDGRFIAYTSTQESGGSTYDIYVRPFPGPGGPRRISTTGGIYSEWSASTHELLFLNYLDPAPSKIMAAPYAVVGDSFQAETPKVWSSVSVQKANPNNSAYDLHPDGKRIAAAAVPDQGNIVQDKVVFIFNFAAHLAKIAPGKK